MVIGWPCDDDEVFESVITIKKKNLENSTHAKSVRKVEVSILSLHTSSKYFEALVYGYSVYLVFVVSIFTLLLLLYLLH
jgi:hypothetical protein